MTTSRPLDLGALALPLLLLATLAPPADARAQELDPAAPEPSVRLGTAMGLGGDAPAVWLGSRRVWVSGDRPYLSACAPGRSCVPVVSQTRCAPPECPGTGLALATEADGAAVGDFPTDHDGYQREIDALRADPRAAMLRQSIADHPDHAEHARREREQREADAREAQRRAESPRWVSAHRDGDRWEGSVAATAATLARGHGSWVGASASLGVGFQLRRRDADEGDDDEALFNALVGDTFGLELRVHALHRVDVDAQEGRWIGAVGLGPLVANRYEHTVVRLPTVVGVAIPELGAVLRDDEDVQFYAAWNVPFSFLLTHEMALDLGLRLMIVEGWIDLAPDAPEGSTPPAEVLLGVSAGLRFL